MSNINYTMEYLWNLSSDSDIDIEMKDPMMRNIIYAQHIQQRMAQRIFRMENGRLVQVEMDDDTEEEDEADSEEEASEEPSLTRVESYERQFVDYKTQIPENKECMISMEDIKLGEMYHICNGCGKSCCNELMMLWWNTCKKQGKEPTCPMCRKPWKDTCIYQYY